MSLNSCLLLLLCVSSLKCQGKLKGAKGMGRMMDITDDLDSIPVEMTSESSPETELQNKVDKEMPTGDEDKEAGGKMDAQQPPNDWESSPAVPEAPCEKPGTKKIPLSELCSLPPHKGRGQDDVFRYYYNPVIQMCIPFSYSGIGGNANRFVSVKNCYEICHPADPQVKKPRVVSGIKAYLAPNMKQTCEDTKKSKKKSREEPESNEVVVRQIPHPLDPRKTLTIIQNARYIQRPNQFSYVEAIDPNVRKLYQYETVPQYVDPMGSGSGYGAPVYSQPAYNSPPLGQPQPPQYGGGYGQQYGQSQPQMYFG